MNTLDWSLLPSFLAVLDSGSLLAASKKLKMSQPTIGRHIEALERQLGVNLFERTVRGLSPSKVATKLAGHVRDMQVGADSLLRELASQTTQLSGTVRITTSQSVAVHVMPTLLAKLRLIAPEIQIELVSSNQVSNLLRREADIALRMLRPVQPSLVARKICEMPMGVFGAKRYLDRKGIPQKENDLLAHDLIGYDQDRSIIQGFQSGHGITVLPENFVFRTDDHVAYFEAVRSGIGLGFLSVYQAQSVTGLKRVLPKLKLLPLPVWLTTHQEIHGNPRIRMVFDFLAQEFPKLVSIT
jgi:DNA-binding transcriptional LysR family regulator